MAYLILEKSGKFNATIFLPDLVAVVTIRARRPFSNGQAVMEFHANYTPYFAHVKNAVWHFYIQHVSKYSLDRYPLNTSL